MAERNDRWTAAGGRVGRAWARVLPLPSDGTYSCCEHCANHVPNTASGHATPCPTCAAGLVESVPPTH